MKKQSTVMRAFAGTTVVLSLLLSLTASCRAFAQSQVSDADSLCGVQASAPEDDSASRAPGQTRLINTCESKKMKAESSSLTSSARPLRKANNDSQTVRYKAGVPCVPLMLVDDPNTLIVCDRDAVIKAEKRCLTLSHGKGIYMVGKYPIVVETALGSVTLPGNSAAIIEQNESGLLRVDHLTGAAATVAVKRWKGIKAFSASSGEEICLAPRTVVADDLVPRDGVAREEISTEVGDGGIQLSENRFAPKTLLDKECLLQCDSNSFFQVRRKVYQLRKTIDEQETASALSPHLSVSPDSMPTLILASEGEQGSEQLSAVTYTEPAAVQLPFCSARSDSALIKYNSKTDIGLDHPSVTELRSGEALVSAYKTTFVKTPNSMLRIAPGTLVLISVSDGVSKVRNLWENHRNSVCQTVENTPFCVLAGDESLTGKDLRSVYLSASRDMIGRRLTHFTELPDGGVVHFAEVSLMSLAQSNDLLLQLMNSNDPVDKSLNRKLNKMAAILVQISASHGLYELMQPPQWRHELKSLSQPALY